jgi:hypothetical protein
VFSIEKHLGEYTLGEILLGKDFKLNVGNGRRLLFEDKVGTDECLPLNYAWHFMHDTSNLIVGFILEARIERKCPYTCLKML